MDFTDLGIRRLNVTKRLEEVNARRRAAGRAEVKQHQIWDTYRKGLGLLISAGGTKTFISQYRLRKGKGDRWLTRAIGRFDEIVTDEQASADATEKNVNVEWARWRVKQDRALAFQGKDPRADVPEEGPEEEPEPTYGEVVDDFIEKYAKPRQRTWKQTESALKTNCAWWLTKPISEVTRARAQGLLDEFVSEGKGPKADITRAWLKTLWRWAWKRDIVTAPVMDALEVNYDRRSRARFWSDDEVRAIWRAGDELSPVEGGYVKLLLLLAPRKSELRHMRRSELDDADEPTLWTTPHERTKSRKTDTSGRVYLTPLPRLAQRIVRGLLGRDAEGGEDDALVFPGRVRGLPMDPGTPLINKLVKNGAPADFNYHAARHTVATWLQNAGHSEFEVGLVLNHSGGGTVTSRYSHGYPIDLKRQLLEKWADHVEKVVRPEGAALLR